MRKITLFSLALGLAVAVLMFMPMRHVAAMQTISQSDVIVDGQTYDQELVISGDNIIFNGTAHKDVYVTGANVTLSGQFDRNVFIAGAKVTLRDATVNRSVYLAGSDVIIDDAVIARNVFAVGGNLDVNAEVKESVFAATGQLVLNGSVGENVNTFAGKALINSTIGENLVLSAGDVTLGENKVAGEIYTYSTPEIDLRKDDSQSTEQARESQDTETFAHKLKIEFYEESYKFVSLALLTYVLIFFFPVFTNRIVSALDNKAGSWAKGFIFGIATLGGLPILALLLTVTVVGIPVAAFLMGLMFALLLVGKLFADTAIGVLIVKRLGWEDPRMVKAVLVGRLVALLIGLIPIFGALYAFVLSTIVLGTFARLKYNSFKLK